MWMRGAALREAKSADELLVAQALGAEFRVSGKTNMNDASSRSHAVLILIVDEPRSGKDGGARGEVEAALSENMANAGKKWEFGFGFLGAAWDEDEEETATKSAAEKEGKEGDEDDIIGVRDEFEEVPDEEVEDTTKEEREEALKEEGEEG